MSSVRHVAVNVLLTVGKVKCFMPLKMEKNSAEGRTKGQKEELCVEHLFGGR